MSCSAGIEELLSKYRRAACATAQISDTKTQNDAADLVHECYKKLKDQSRGREGIAKLMFDPNPYVRGYAAAHALQWAPEQARPVLEALRNEDVFPYSLNAEIVLDEFDMGRLTFDY